MISGLTVFGPYGWRIFPAGEKVILTPGVDTLSVNISVSYRGPAQTLTLYGAIGDRSNGFDERLFGRSPLNCPESAAFTPIQSSVAIPIPANTPAVTDFDVYVKIEERPDVTDFVDDVIDITAAPSFLSQTVGMLMMMPLMMMGMMAPMFLEEEEMAAEEAVPEKE